MQTLICSAIYINKIITSTVFVIFHNISLAILYVIAYTGALRVLHNCHRKFVTIFPRDLVNIHANRIHYTQIHTYMYIQSCMCVCLCVYVTRFWKLFQIVHF